MLPILLGPSMRTVRWYSKISLFTPGPAVDAKISGALLSLDLDLEPAEVTVLHSPLLTVALEAGRVGMLRGPRSSTTAETS